MSHPFRYIMGSYARLLDFGRYGRLSSRLLTVEYYHPRHTDPQPGDLAGFARSSALIKPINEGWPLAPELWLIVWSLTPMMPVCQHID